MNTINTNSTNQKVITILKWIFSILISLLALGALVSNSFLSFLILLLVAFLIFPPLTEFWRHKLPFLKNRITKIVIVITLFIAGFAVSNKIDKTTSTNKDENKTEQKVTNSEEVNNTQQIATITEEEIEETVEVENITTINHEILHEAIIRYDKAPTYFVLIEEVDLSNDKFKEDVKNLINKIINEKGAKISVEILDNKKALELLYKSDYGVNTLGRELNKSELTKLEIHSIATYSGELNTSVYTNTLYFFLNASNSNAKVKKYIESIDYNPVIIDEIIITKQRAEVDNQKAESDKKKKDFKNNCFNAWDGSHIELVNVTKSKMNDKKSFEHVKTTYSIMDNYAIVLMQFRGKNAFGNIVLNTVKAKVSFDCKVLEFIE